MQHLLCKRKILGPVCSVWLPYCNKREVKLRASLRTGVISFIIRPMMCIASLGRCWCGTRLYSSHTARSDSENLIL